MPWPTEAFVSTANNMLDKENTILLDNLNRKKTVISLVKGHQLFLDLAEKHF
jgi:hypothetical protein